MILLNASLFIIIINMIDYHELAWSISYWSYKRVSTFLPFLFFIIFTMKKEATPIITKQAAITRIMTAGLNESSFLLHLLVAASSV